MKCYKRGFTPTLENGIVRKYGRRPMPFFSAGFTLLETLIALVIFSALLLIAVSHWSLLTKSQALSKDRLGAISMFEQARAMAVASKSNSGYGVNISSTTVTIFKGSVYNPSDSDNMFYNLNSLVQVYSISLAGGGSNVLFERLSGNTSQSGNIRISSISDPTSSTTVTIFTSGVVQ
jgi:prepilin-type N-terminal cleavage/methylation domain-containing protein